MLAALGTAILVLLPGAHGQGQTCFGTCVQTIRVAPLEEQLVIVKVNPGLTVTVRLQISGGGNDINVFVTDPNGATIVNNGRVTGGTSFQFRTTVGGGYTIHLDNRFSIITSKTVVATINVGSLGCFIATATYGSELAGEVVLLRGFRDHVMPTPAGSYFILFFNVWYYSFSPTVADEIRSDWVTKRIMRVALYPGLLAIHAASMNYHVFWFNHEIAVISSGILASALLGFVYVALPIGLCLGTIGRSIHLRTNHVRALTILILVGVGITRIGELLGMPSLLQISSVFLVVSTIAFMATTGLLALSRPLRINGK